jgi:hypothetical protein
MDSGFSRWGITPHQHEKRSKKLSHIEVTGLRPPVRPFLKPEAPLLHEHHQNLSV